MPEVALGATSGSPPPEASADHHSEAGLSYASFGANGSVSSKTIASKPSMESTVPTGRHAVLTGWELRTNSSQCRSNELAIHSYRQRKATRHEPYKQAPSEANLVLIIF